MQHMNFENDKINLNFQTTGLTDACIQTTRDLKDFLDRRRKKKPRNETALTNCW